MFSALIIDADESASQAIERTLIPYGVDLTRTADPAEALTLARTQTPDLILLRVELPGSSGFSVCNKLRRNEETQYIPLVMYASNTPDDVISQHRGLRTKADEYLRLPFAGDSLLTAVRALVPLPAEPTREGPAAVADEGSSALMGELADDFGELEVEVQNESASASTSAARPLVDLESSDEYAIARETEAAFETLLIDDDEGAAPAAEVPDISIHAAEPEPASAVPPAADAGADAGGGESLSAVRREALALKAQIVAKDRELLALREELDQRDRTILEGKEKARRLEASLADAEGRLLAHEESVVSAQESVDAAQRDKQTILKREEGLKNRLELAQKKHKEAEDELEAAKAKIEELTAAQDALRAQADTASAKLAILEGAHEEANAELEELQSSSAKRLADLEEQAAQSQALVDELTNKQSTMVETIGALERDLAMAKQQAAGELEELRQSHHVALSEIGSNNEKALAELRQSLTADKEAALKEQADSQSAELAFAEQEAETAAERFRAQVRELNAKVEALSAELTQAQAAAKDQAEAAHAAQVRADSLAAELAELRGQINMSSEARRKAQQALAVALRVLE